MSPDQTSVNANRSSGKAEKTLQLESLNTQTIMEDEMRLILSLCLLFVLSTPLVADSPSQPTQAELVRQYSSAMDRRDDKAAKRALEQLQGAFPKDSVTKLITEHWEHSQKEKPPASWKELTKQRQTNPQESPDAENSTALSTTVYKVADLIVPPSDHRDPQDQQRLIKRHCEELARLIQLSVTDSHSQAEVQPHAETMSLVVLGTEETNEKIRTLLNQIRRRYDLQVSLEVCHLSLPADVAKNLGRREIVTHSKFAAMLAKLNASGATQINYSPKVTLFDEQSAKGTFHLINLNLHAAISEDRRTVRTEIRVQQEQDSDHPAWSFATSEVIPDSHTALFFVRTSDAVSPDFDRRLLIEQGINVPPSTSHQEFIAVTPRILIREEEEALLGVEKVIRQQPLTSLPSYGSPYWTQNLTLPRGWPSIKLNWDDGDWNLDWNDASWTLD